MIYYIVNIIAILAFKFSCRIKITFYHFENRDIMKYAIILRRYTR